MPSVIHSLSLSLSLLSRVGVGATGAPTLFPVAAVTVWALSLSQFIDMILLELMITDDAD